MCTKHIALYVSKLLNICINYDLSDESIILQYNSGLKGDLSLLT
jgi:hypothetical protein